KSANYFKYNAIVYIDLKLINFNKAAYSFKYLFTYFIYKITNIYEITLILFEFILLFMRFFL
ncbi:MAG TPA: hypothetical protein DCW42_01355, partial [Bacteroidetes bacterium]|nr:hypothetical protein [Bacteroidota bacterium]